MAAPLDPDHAMVQAARRRNPAAVEWLGVQLRCVPRFIAILLRRHGGSSSDAKDLAQQAAAVALARLANYHGLAPFVAWLHRICDLTVRGALRRQRRESSSLAIEPAVQADPAADAQREEHRERVRRAIDAVGGAEADVIRWRHLDSEDFGDISARTGIPLATLRTRYYRGLEKLRAILRTDIDPEVHA